MKKQIPVFISRVFNLGFILNLMFMVNANAQLVVATTPQPKNFLIEKGSGIACCSCPGISAKCKAIIDSFPQGKGILMIYHFGPDARPQAGQLNKDYKTTFGDSIMTPTWPFYLNMMVNRRDGGPPYGSTFIFGPNNDQVRPECESVAAQTAPVNLAMASTYNATTREISIDVKAYYTASSVTVKNYLQIAIVEDSIVGPQCVNSAPFIYNYVHMEMFRANVNGFRGDSIFTTTSGTTVTKTYKYTVPAKYGSGADPTAWVTPNPKFFRLILFMTEDFNGYNTKFGKIQNVIAVPLGASSNSTGVEEILAGAGISIFPNPSKGIFTVGSDREKIKAIEVIDMMGKVAYKSSAIENLETSLDLRALQNGIYHVKVITEKCESVHKVLLID